jgi:hypothetical protein
MKGLSIFLLGFILFAAGCKKKAPAPQPPFVASQYDYRLAVGNYWVYQRIDTSSGTPFSSIDSLNVLSDTVLRGIPSYYLTDAPFEGISQGYYGDSAGVILSMAYDNAFVLSNRPNDTLSVSTNIVTTVQRIGKVDTIINVPAGAFSCVQVITDIYFPPGFTVTPPATNPTHKYCYYCKNVGLICGTTFFERSPQDVITMQLTAYHINP